MKWRPHRRAQSNVSKCQSQNWKRSAYYISLCNEYLNIPNPWQMVTMDRVFLRLLHRALLPPTTKQEKIHQGGQLRWGYCPVSEDYKREAGHKIWTLLPKSLHKSPWGWYKPLPAQYGSWTTRRPTKPLQMKFNSIYSTITYFVNFLWPDIAVWGPTALQEISLLLQSRCIPGGGLTYSKGWYHALDHILKWTFWQLKRHIPS